MNDLPLDDLPKGKGDPDFHGYPGQKPSKIHYIGEDKAVIERHVDNPHWSELPKVVNPSTFPSWYDQDNSARSPLEADLEDMEL